MRGTCVVLAGLVASVASCGDNQIPLGDFEVVGHAEIGARGMNAALAVAGDTVYVGSRIDTAGIAILDVTDPAAPTQVGELPGHAAMSSRELRAAGDVLVVLSLQCDPMLHGCAQGPAEPEAIQLYDITDRHAPVLRSTYPIIGAGFNPKSPHEMYLRQTGTQTLLYIAEPPKLLEVLDITNPAAPVQVALWDPGIGGQGGDDILHSVSVSADGTQLYLSHQLSGLFVADDALPAPALVTPLGHGLDFSPPGTVGPHSAVEVPGRDLLIVTEEIYPPPYGTGCPWGPIRIVDIAHPEAPVLRSTIGVPENDPAFCTEDFDRVTYTAHNSTATADLALVSWHAAGLQVMDTADPDAPELIGAFVPEPLPAVTSEDPGLGGRLVEMWSYPVIQRGLIYVVDVRNGLYVLRYRGRWQEQIDREVFLEGNSNL